MYYKLLSKAINKKKNKKEISDNILNETLHNVIEHFPFSTFPYICSNMNSSESTKYFKSGNCIALCIAGQNYLKQNHNIVSYIIPASVPKMFQKPKYLHISHVALFVPQDKNLGFILDFAFYFNETIRVHLDNYTDEFYSKMQNIYKNQEQDLKYKLNILKKKTTFNNYQEFPKNTKYIKICYINDNPDCWNYYLREIINPDKAITNFYIQLNRKPFFCLVDNNYNMKLYIRVSDNDQATIRYSGEIIHDGKLDKIPNNIRQFIEPMIGKYLNYDVPFYFNNLNRDHSYHFKDSSKTLKRSKSGKKSKTNKNKNNRKRNV